MRVNYDFAQPRNTFFNANRINQSLEKDSPIARKASGKKPNRDVVALSPQGKMMNIIENLNKQKESINENRSALISRTMKNGRDMETIQPQLDLYAEQLTDIDKQISDVYMQQAQQVVQQMDEKKSEHANKNKTAEELDAQQMNQLSAVSEDVKQAEKIASVQTQVEGNARVKEAQNGLSELTVDMLESRGLDGVTNVKPLIATAKKVIHARNNDIAALRVDAAQVGTRHARQLRKAAATLEDSRDAGAAPAKEKDPSEIGPQSPPKTLAALAQAETAKTANNTEPADNAAESKP